MPARRFVPPLSLATVYLLATAGCSSDNTAKEIAAMNNTNIQRVANLYAAFQTMRSPNGPKDEAEFKDWIKAYNPVSLSAMSVDPNNLDKTFTSERDNKPFKVRYKVGGGRGSVAPVVFEDTGVNGMRQVGFTGGGGPGGGGAVEEVDAAHYKDLWDGKVSTPSAGGAGGPGGGPTGGGRPIGMPAGAPKGPGG
jgi:hypothetical protein